MIWKKTKPCRKDLFVSLKQCSVNVPLMYHLNANHARVELSIPTTVNKGEFEVIGHIFELGLFMTNSYPVMNLL